MLNVNAIKWHYCGRAWAEASELGLPVGRWPRWFVVDGVKYTAMKAERREGEIVRVLYQAEAPGSILAVYND